MSKNRANAVRGVGVTIALAAGMLAMTAVPATAQDLNLGNALNGLFGGNNQNSKPPAGGNPNAVEKAKNQDRVTGAAGGAAAGAVIGGAVDGKKGALIGAGIGTVTGLVVGNEMANRRQDYADKYQEIDTAIAISREKIARLQTETTQIERQTAARKSEISKLQAQAKSDATNAGAQSAMLTRIDADIKANRKAREEADIQNRVLQKDIADLDGLVAKDPNDPGLAERRATMIGQRDQLLQTLRKLNGIDSTLNAQKNQVGAGIKG